MKYQTSASEMNEYMDCALLIFAENRKNMTPGLFCLGIKLDKFSIWDKMLGELLILINLVKKDTFGKKTNPVFKHTNLSTNLSKVHWL